MAKKAGNLPEAETCDIGEKEASPQADADRAEEAHAAEDEKSWAPPPPKAPIARTPDDKKAWGGGPKAAWKNHAAAASAASNAASNASSSWRGSQWDERDDWNAVALAKSAGCAAEALGDDS